MITLMIVHGLLTVLGNRLHRVEVGLGHSSLQLLELATIFSSRDANTPHVDDQIRTSLQEQLVVEAARV